MQYLKCFIKKPLENNRISFSLDFNILNVCDKLVGSKRNAGDMSSLLKIASVDSCSLRKCVCSVIMDLRLLAKIMRKSVLVMTPAQIILRGAPDPEFWEVVATFHGSHLDFEELRLVLRGRPDAAHPQLHWMRE